LEDYNQAIEIDPQYGDAFYNRANLKKELGDKSFNEDYMKATQIWKDTHSILEYTSTH
jgi:tetratricopeptide (TPR) repeat protein